MSSALTICETEEHFASADPYTSSIVLNVPNFTPLAFTLFTFDHVEVTCPWAGESLDPFQQHLSTMFHLLGQC